MESSRVFKNERRPHYEELDKFMDLMKRYLFPGAFDTLHDSVEEHKKSLLSRIKNTFLEYISNDEKKCETFLKKIPLLEEELYADLDFFYESDPACESRLEIVYAYPGYQAIVYYRISHALYELDIPYIPRIISETVHSKTGIDIHPGAKIGSPFLIDHGTGIVVGETAEIGKRVKIYHGVTLGALSLKEGRALSGKKRHPTIKDNVTIYSGASILGGDTVIGENVTIGSNVFIVNSVVEDTTLIYTNDSVKEIK